MEAGSDLLARWQGHEQICDGLRRATPYRGAAMCWSCGREEGLLSSLNMLLLLGAATASGSMKESMEPTGTMWRPCPQRRRNVMLHGIELVGDHGGASAPVCAAACSETARRPGASEHAQDAPLAFAAGLSSECESKASGAAISSACTIATLAPVLMTSRSCSQTSVLVQVRFHGRGRLSISRRLT